MQKSDQVFSPSENQLAHIIKEQFEAPINCLLKEGHVISAAKLMLSGIDLMGYLAMPDGKTKLDVYSFKSWTEKYLEMVKLGQLQAEEVWKTRCDLLHAHGYRDRAENNQLRYVVFCELSTPPAYEIDGAVDFVVVPIEKFLNDFLDGARKCTYDLYEDKIISIRTQNRLEHVQYMRREYVTLDGHIITLGGEPVTIDWSLRHLRKIPGEDA